MRDWKTVAVESSPVVDLLPRLNLSLWIVFALTSRGGSRRIRPSCPDSVERAGGLAEARATLLTDRPRRSLASHAPDRPGRQSTTASTPSVEFRSATPHSRRKIPSLRHCSSSAVSWFFRLQFGVLGNETQLVGISPHVPEMSVESEPNSPMPLSQSDGRHLFTMPVPGSSALTLPLSSASFALAGL